MKKEMINVTPITLIGLSVRTTNAVEFTPASLIGPLVQRFFAENIMGKIQHTLDPHTA